MSAEFRKIKGTPRKEALGMNQMMRMFIRANGLTASLNTQRVFDAWDVVSGVKDYTLRRFYRDGKLYITVASSMIRSHLEFQKDSMVKAINEQLEKDNLFDSDYEKVGLVKELILR